MLMLMGSAMEDAQQMLPCPSMDVTRSGGSRDSPTAKPKLELKSGVLLEPKENFVVLQETTSEPVRENHPIGKGSVIRPHQPFKPLRSCFTFHHKVQLFSAILKALTV